MVQLGKKLSPSAAKEIVDQLYALVRERWEIKVNQTPFMQQLMAGKLPLKVLQTFFRNWAPIRLRSCMLTACTCHRILLSEGKPDLMGPIGEKIADEFIHPSAAIFVMLQTAQARPHRRSFTTPMLSSSAARSISCAASSMKERRRSGTPR
jgi:hypothetical protein